MPSQKPADKVLLSIDLALFLHDYVLLFSPFQRLICMGGRWHVNNVLSEPLLTYNTLKEFTEKLCN